MVVSSALGRSCAAIVGRHVVAAFATACTPSASPDETLRESRCWLRRDGPAAPRSCLTRRSQALTATAARSVSRWQGSMRARPSSICAGARHMRSGAGPVDHRAARSPRPDLDNGDGSFIVPVVGTLGSRPVAASGRGRGRTHPVVPLADLTRSDNV